MTFFSNLDSAIEQLNLSNRKLTSVCGIEQFTNLKTLNLKGNLLQDCAFLLSLPNLVDVNLSDNQIETIHFNSLDIEKLNLAGNRLTNVEFASSLKYLTSLNVRDNQITSISPLRELQNLTHVNIRGNSISSLAPLSAARSLTNLNARDNNIHAITPISDLPLHERLFLKGNEMTDLHVIRGKEIEKIDFDLTIQKPTFSKASGVCEPFNLTINGPKASYIHYTFDGTNPTFQSPKYTKPIKISEHLYSALPIYANYQTSPYKKAFSFERNDVKKAVTIKAIAIKNGQKSDVSIATYILDPHLFTAPLPLVTLTMDPNDLFDDEAGIYVPGMHYKQGDASTGNYYGRGRSFEKIGDVHFFHKNGDLHFKQTVGVRINGSYTRRFPQKSLRLYARKRYGQSKFVANIFHNVPYTQFKRLVLHNGGNDFYSTLIRDGLMHELIKDIEIDVQGYLPVQVLLNGEYWGIHHLREKYNKHYIQTKYNVQEKDLVLLKLSRSKGTEFNIEVGSKKDKQMFDQLVHYVMSKSLLTNKDIQEIDTMMDIKNFLTYVACQVYYGNTDSFSNNVMVWKKRTAYTKDAPVGHDGRFRWMLYDLDWGMGYRFDDSLNYTGDRTQFNMLEHVLSNKKEMSLFRNLMQNSSIQHTFTYILLALLRTNFEPYYVTTKIEELVSSIRPAVPDSLKRWGNVASVEQWEENISFLYEFANRRPAVVRQQLEAAGLEI